MTSYRSLLSEQDAPPSTGTIPIPRRELRTIQQGLVGHRRRIHGLRIVWAGALLAIVLVPLALSVRAGYSGDLMIEFSLTSGLLAFSALVATLVLPSRVRSLTRAFGIERVLRSHRWFGLLSMTLVLIHLAFVVIDKPANLALLYPPSAPPRARAATAATVAIVLMCLLTLARRRLRTRYEIWRALHVVLAMVVVGGTVLHVLWLNHLLRDAAMRWCFVTTGLVVAVILGNRWIRRPLVAARNAFAVEEIRPESADVSTLVLVPANRSSRGLAFRPGQFAWIRLDSPWGPLQSHPFTIASGAHEQHRLEFTIRHVGDFTASLTALRPGRRVYVDGPHGSFNDDHEGAPSLLLVAAGVGITPMMSILRTQAARCDPRRYCLVVGARALPDLLFRHELRLMRNQLDLEVVEVLSDASPSWTGRRGRIDGALIEDVLAEQPGLTEPHAYLCGPAQMIADVHADLLGLGFPPRQVHTEQFDLV
jgi:predicted ferric reductase